MKAEKQPHMSIVKLVEDWENPNASNKNDKSDMHLCVCVLFFNPDKLLSYLVQYYLEGKWN